MPKVWRSRPALGPHLPLNGRVAASAWLDRADTQLYQAKARGGNLVCLDLDPLVAVSAEEKNMLFAAFGADLAAAGAHTVEDSL